MVILLLMFSTFFCLIYIMSRVIPEDRYLNYAERLQDLPIDYIVPTATIDKNGFMVMNNYVDSLDPVEINKRLGNTGDIPSLKTYAANEVVKNMIGKNKDHYIINTDKTKANQFITELNKDLERNDLPEDIDKRIADVALLHRLNAEQFNNLPRQYRPLINDDTKLMIDNFRGKSNISEIPFIDDDGTIKNRNTIFTPLRGRDKSEFERKTKRNDYSRFNLYNAVFTPTHPLGKVLALTPQQEEMNDMRGHRFFTFK